MVEKKKQDTIVVKFSPKEVSSNDQRIYKNYNLVIILGCIRRDLQKFF